MELRPKITASFLNEVEFRRTIIRDCLDLFEEYRGKKGRGEVEYFRLMFLRFVLVTTAVLQAATLLDKTGRFSLRLQKEKRGYSVDARRLGQLFPKCTSVQIGNLKREIDSLCNQYKTLIERIFSTRHEIIAHANTPDNAREKNYLSQVRFPLKKMGQLVGKLFRVLWETGFATLEKI